MATPKAFALILAGGRGTRFWPRSRRRMPKQLLRFGGERSLLQQAVDRLQPLIPPSRVWILTNTQLRHAVQKQVPEIPPRQILVEPAERNTAPCLALAAQVIAEIDPKAVLGVFPADHYIADADRFRHFAAAALCAADSDKLLTLGIPPRWPETGYGYLEFPRGTVLGSTEPVLIRRFREKPDATTARRYLKSGHYFWNAGVFFWRAETFLACVRKYLPRTATLLERLPGYNDRKFTSKLKMIYPSMDGISVDFAVMEPASQEKRVFGLATDDFGWNDLGSWNAAYALDPGGALKTDTIQHDASGCFVDVPGKTVALVGVKDLIVVETKDALLIATRQQAQDVGQLVKLLERQHRTDLL